MVVRPRAWLVRRANGWCAAQWLLRRAPHGLRFGPDPSTQTRATIGGMIGNNACGPHAVAYGRTADNVAGARPCVDGDGPAIRTPGRACSRSPALDALVAVANLGRDPHRVRPVRPPGLRLLAGAPAARARPRPGQGAGRHRGHARRSISSATVAAGPDRPARLLVVLGYPDMPTAADAVPALLAHAPARHRGHGRPAGRRGRAGQGAAAVPDLPPGAGWLIVEVGGDDAGRGARPRARAGRATPAPLRFGRARRPGRRGRMWQIRADGAGLAGRTPAGGRPGPAGRTPRCRRRGSARTCASSRR